MITGLWKECFIIIIIIIISKLLKAWEVWKICFIVNYVPKQKWSTCEKIYIHTNVYIIMCNQEDMIFKTLCSKSIQLESMLKFSSLACFDIGVNKKREKDAKCECELLQEKVWMRNLRSQYSHFTTILNNRAKISVRISCSLVNCACVCSCVCPSSLNIFIVICFCNFSFIGISSYEKVINVCMFIDI